MVDPASRLAAALADRYRIERELGAGGMATVYLAADLKHDRKVAIKVLKPELAAVLGAERFVQEIKTTAALSHPHILPLFDSGEADGFLYYVMPYLQGETIREKLNRETQFGIEEAVKITTEVAEALDYAHQNGVIHRDIKPENILLHAGRPMVMDFGIALAVSAAAGGRMTETGLSLGTPHYMSPEQATAEKDITARSDVYSLASVMYEMLAGQPPHLGGSAQQIIMKIIAEPAQPVTAMRKSVPAHVADALATALEKLPADRFASAREFAQALTAGVYSRTLSTGAVSAAAGHDWRSRVAVPAMVLSALLLAVVGVVAMRPTPEPSVGRFDVAVQGFGSSPNAGFAVSRDGQRFVNLQPDLGLSIRRRDQLEQTRLQGTEGADNPAFSPDGQRVVFMQGGTLRIVDINGGPPTLLTDSAVGGPGLAWGTDGYVYYDGRNIRGLMRVAETGGAPEEVSTLDSASGELQHVWPDPLPNGRGVIMVVNRGGPGIGAAENDGIAVLDLKTRRHRELFRGVYARYSPSGHLLYVTRDGTLMGVPFDQQKLETAGTPVALASGLSVRTGMGAVDLAIADDGTLWYSTGGGVEAQELAWVARDGTATPFTHQVPGVIQASIRLSPDMTRLAYSAPSQSGGYIEVLDIARGTRNRLTFDGSYDFASWHPDGQALVLMSTSSLLYTIAADGSSLPQLVPGIPGRAARPHWAPDGSGVLFELYASAETRSDIALVTPGVDSQPRSLVATDQRELRPSMSPDGHWLLFEQGTPSGRPRVFVRPSANPMSSLRQVADAGSDPKWSSNGREIYYLWLGLIYAVPVLDGPGFSVGEERMVPIPQGVLGYDVARDGRLVILRPKGSAAERRLIMVEHFDVELKEKFGK